MTATDPASLLAAVEGRSQRLTTPCGDGDMVWHRWGDNSDRLVLLHGGYGSWTHWIRNVDVLARRYTVLAADLPGLGDSAAAPEPYDGATLSVIVADGIKRLVPEGARCHLAGFSFGGVLGGPTAALLGDRLASFTIVGAGGMGARRKPIDLQAWRHLPDEAARNAVHATNLGLLMIADPAKIDDLAVLLQAGNARRGRTKSRPISLAQTLSDALPKVKAPVSAIFGERDATAYPWVSEREERMRAIRPELDFRVIPEAGHWVQYEAADAFNRELLDVLAKREGSARS
ncbi:MAG: alpha/beta fold hydrolase [Alphaproteobacteria bacterium]